MQWYSTMYTVEGTVYPYKAAFSVYCKWPLQKNAVIYIQLYKKFATCNKANYIKNYKLILQTLQNYTFFIG